MYISLPIAAKEYDAGTIKPCYSTKRCTEPFNVVFNNAGSVSLVYNNKARLIFLTDIKNEIHTCTHRDGADN